jgi:hypothetical protein
LDGNYIGGYDQLKAFLVMNPVENSWRIGGMCYV